MANRFEIISLALWWLALVLCSILWSKDLGELIRRRMRPVFHWHAAILLPSLWGAGVGMIEIDRFALANSFFVLGTIWGIGCWLTSDQLHRKKQGTTNRTYDCWKWGVVTAILLSGWLSIVLTVFLAHIKEQDNVYQHLTARTSLSTYGDPFLTMFVVTNSGSGRIGAHTISCVINLLISDWNVFRNFRLIAKSSDAQLLPGGDSQSDPCLAILRLKNPQCFDVTLSIIYSLEDQPTSTRTKEFRFVGQMINGSFEWNQQPVSQKESYCAFFLKDAQRKTQ